VSAAGGATLLNTGEFPAFSAAIPMVAITVGTDEEETATLLSVAKDLTKREFRGRRDQNHRAPAPESLDIERALMATWPHLML
jgi:hypothetical protein